MAWLDAAFPVTASGPRVRKHRLTNLGMGGTGSCACVAPSPPPLSARAPPIPRSVSLAPRAPRPPSPRRSPNPLDRARRQNRYARRLDALLDARLIGRVDLVLAEFAINDAELHGNAPPPPFGDHYHGVTEVTGPALALSLSRG